MNSSNNKWLLPDGIEELLPEQAQHIEQFRRRVLDVFSVNGYQLVQPPLLEYLSSLLTGAGHDLDLLTFKVTDQHTGRMMGVRADMTPQLSRIDAHVLNQNGPTRLCYAGPVLQTAHRSGFHSREPFQIGAELFGCSELEADVEIIRLCADVLDSLEITNPRFDFGHIGIFNALIKQSELSGPQTRELLKICQRKSWPDMETFLNKGDINPDIAKILNGMLHLEGPPEETLNNARALFKNAGAEVQQQFDQFQKLIYLINDYLPNLNLSIDLLELRGINYHTGTVFSVYCDDYANAIAKGGRYDDVGSAFGRAREATGFSADLRQAISFSDYESNGKQHMIYAPFDCDPSLKKIIDELKRSGEPVVVEFENEEYCANARALVKQDGQWVIKAKGQ